MINAKEWNLTASDETIVPRAVLVNITSSTRALCCLRTIFNVNLYVTLGYSLKYVMELIRIG